MDRNDLAIRMKNYENVSNIKLTNRSVVILRLDMRCGHIFTKGFVRPFDDVFIKSMQDTAKYLCENIQNVVMSYQQSDEISLVLVDYDSIVKKPWFDNRIQKLCSIAASMATLAFNRKFVWHRAECLGSINGNDLKQYNIYSSSVKRGATFDCRAFNLPKDEVANYMYWRQEDAIRNSIQMVGQASFSHNELQNKSCKDIKSMLIEQKNIDWDNDLTTCHKRGSCCINEEYITNDINNKDIQVIRHRWIIDDEIPVFKNDGRKYVNSRILYND